jgi:hypothetical protein
MKYLRLVGVAILAICAIAAVTASAAQAESPALFTYTGSGAFTITSGAGQLVTTGGLELACKGDNGTGQLGGKGGTTQALTASLTVTFTGCETLSKKCTSAGLTAGNIQTVPLVALLGRISPGVAGAKLEPKTGEQVLVPVHCGEFELKRHGAVIGQFTTATDKQTARLTLAFAQTDGVQAIKKFEGETGSVNLVEEFGASPEEAGLESTETLTLKEGSGTLLA